MDRDRRQAGAEDLRAGGVDEVLDEHLRADHEGPLAAEGLAEGTGEDVDLPVHTLLLGQAAAAVAADADPVRLVHVEHRLPAVAQLHQSGQVGGVAVHAEDRLGDNVHLPIVVPLVREDPFDGRVVQVRVADRPGPRQAHAVDQAGVAELVGEDQVLPAGERRQDADVDVVAGVEHQGRLGPVEGAQLLFETDVRPGVAGHQPRGGAAQRVVFEQPGPVLFGVEGTQQGVVGRQAEVVVAGQVEAGAAVDVDAAPVQVGDRHEPAQLAIVLDLCQRSGQLVKKSGHSPMSGSELRVQLVVVAHQQSVADAQGGGAQGAGAAQGFLEDRLPAVPARVEHQPLLAFGDDDLPGGGEHLPGLLLGQRRLAGVCDRLAGDTVAIEHILCPLARGSALSQVGPVDLHERLLFL